MFPLVAEARNPGEYSGLFTLRKLMSFQNSLSYDGGLRLNLKVWISPLTLQRLYDSEINITITWLWDGGFDFALISYMEWEESGRPMDFMKRLASVDPVETG